MIISPGGFEEFFEALIEHGAGGPPPEVLDAMASEYGLELDPSSVPDLMETYGLTFGPPAG